MYHWYDTKNRIQGFTLLELLMVIAIVAILLTLAVNYIDTSRSKGSDANVKANLKNAMSQAEVYYINQARTYTGLCNDQTIGIFKKMQSAKRAFGGATQSTYDVSVASTWQTEACHDSVTAFAAWVPLKESTPASPVGWCVDSLGVGKKVTAILASNATQCP